MNIIAALDANDVPFDMVKDVYGGVYEIHFYANTSLTFDLLDRVVAALGTRLVDVKSDYERSYYDVVHSKLVLKVKWV